MISAGEPPHLERVQHRSASVTLVEKEFEADVRVAAKNPVAVGIVALTLREASDHRLPEWAPGAHVDLVLRAAPTRQYSLCGDPADRHAYRLAILRDPAGGGGSTYVHDRLKVGDVVRIRGPRNNFPLVASPRYLFIAGGIGITPLIPMIAGADAVGSDWRLVYAGRHRSAMSFLDELARFGDRVSIRSSEETGRADLDALLGVPEPDTLVYCCGPERLIAAVEERCRTWPSRTLHVERFTPKPIAQTGQDHPFEVILRRSDLTLTVPPGRSILSIVEEAGIGVVSSCAKGTCGTCETAVLEGEPDHRDSVLNEEERRANECMMICCSRARGPRLVLDL